MKPIVSIVVAVVVAVTAGCVSVVLDSPIGEPLELAEKARLVGRWMDGDSRPIEIQLAKDGTLVVGSLSWNAKQEKYQAENRTIEARKCGDAILLLLRDDVGGLAFVRVELVGNAEIKIFNPDPEKAHAAIEAGKLPGKVVPGEGNRRNVVIEASSPLTKPMLSASDLSVLYDDAQILRRLIAPEARE